MNKIQLTDYLYHHIPITKHMQIHVIDCSPNKVSLMAPLAANFNHKQTAFGGSISTLAIVSAWSLLYCRLIDLPNEIVIAQNSIQYLKPISGDIIAICEYNDEINWQLFMDYFEKKGRARIELRSTIEFNGQISASFNGKYVAFNKSF